MPESMRVRGGVVRFVRVSRVAGLAGLLALAGVAHAGEKGGKRQEGSSPGARASSNPGALLIRSPLDNKSWQVAPLRMALHVGESLPAPPGMVAEIEAGKDAPVLKLRLVGNLPGLYRTAALESEARLNEAKDADIDFTLLRGRVVLTHVGKKGTTAHCRVRVMKESWDLDLTEPGTRVSLGVMVRRLPWTEFPKNPDPKLRPTTELNLLVLEGSVDLIEASVRQTLGPLSRYHWRSDVGAEDVSVLKELPPDMTAAADANAKKLLAATEKLQGLFAGKRPPVTLLADLLEDKDEAVRTTAVYGLVAVGDVPTGLRGLADPKHADVRRAAVLALRHWIGHSYEDDQRLYEMLLLQKYSKTHGEIVVQLLHNFTQRQLVLPETYEALIHYLTNDRLAIRELASWHLARLVPDGDRIAYDPVGTPAQLRQGQSLWRKRIPEGKLPSALSK